jgi:protein SCO1/2
VNQNNLKVSNETYKGKVYVLIFFTTCPTICPKMNQSMLSIEKVFCNPNFGIASITIDPAHDTPAILKAKLLGCYSSNWNFLTGDRQTILIYQMLIFIPCLVK